MSDQTGFFNQILDKLSRGEMNIEEARAAIATADEPTRVVTVRMPQTLHEQLRKQAHAEETSMNKLCISGLVNRISLQPPKLELAEAS